MKANTVYLIAGLIYLIAIPLYTKITGNDYEVVSLKSNNKEVFAIRYSSDVGSFIKFKD